VASPRKATPRRRDSQPKTSIGSPATGSPTPKPVETLAGRSVLAQSSPEAADLQPAIGGGCCPRRCFALPRASFPWPFRPSEGFRCGKRFPQAPCCLRRPVLCRQRGATNSSNSVEQPLAATQTPTECIALLWMPALRGACPTGASSASPGLSRHRRGYPGRDGSHPANPNGI